MFDKLVAQLKTGILNAGLNFISIEEKLCYMFWGTKPSKINSTLIIPVTTPCMKKFVDELKKSKDYQKEGKVHNGTLNGVKVSIIRAEVGTPNAAIMMEMAARIHVKNIIRVDVCGTISPTYPIGSVVIPPMALSGEGTGAYYLRKFASQLKENLHVKPSENSNISSYSVEIYNPKWTEIKNSIEMKKKTYSVGFPTVWTTDAIFCEDNKEIKLWKALNAECVDMETAVMYLLSQIYSIPTISIMGVTDYPGDTDYDLLTSNKIHPEMELAMDRAITKTIELLPLLNSN